MLRKRLQPSSIRPHGRTKRQFRCRLCDLAKTAKENSITKTALIVVGGFLGDTYERSKLYDPTFTTEFREATK